jgi:hypothetical protein
VVKNGKLSPFENLYQTTDYSSTCLIFLRGFTTGTWDCTPAKHKTPAAIRTGRRSSAGNSEADGLLLPLSLHDRSQQVRSMQSVRLLTSRCYYFGNVTLATNTSLQHNCQHSNGNVVSTFVSRHNGVHAASKTSSSASHHQIMTQIVTGPLEHYLFPKYD